MKDFTYSILLHALVSKGVLTNKEVTALKTIDNLSELLVQKGVLNASDLEADSEVGRTFREICDRIMKGSTIEDIFTAYESYFTVKGPKE